MPQVQDPVLEQAKIEARFWAKVNKTEGCWIWLGATQGKGYGTFSLAGKSQQAHRVAFMLIHGAFPLPNLTLDHLCHNRSCVNPKHLRIATHQENILAGNGQAAREARQTHCIHGHPFSKDNTMTKSNGGRDCRTCNRFRSNRRNKGMSVPNS